MFIRIADFQLLGPLLSALHASTHSVITKTVQGPYCCPYFTDGEIKPSALGYSASKWQGGDLVPSSEAPEPMLTTHTASLRETGRKAMLLYVLLFVIL